MAARTSKRTAKTAKKKAKTTKKASTAKKSKTGKPSTAKKSKTTKKAAGPAKKARTDGKAKTGKPVLLAGDNPQIAKADGDAPVQAYLAAVPGWKQDVARRLDSIIARTVPGVRKAIRWNSPFYGVEGRGWFLSFHCFTKYVKVTFFRGASLRPSPPGGSKHPDVRYHDVYEGELDEAQFAEWVRQASELPGWSGG